MYHVLYRLAINIIEDQAGKYVEQLRVIKDRELN